jgi:tripartite-type tricarboxylate transporter receptor subunit TctC
MKSRFAFTGLLFAIALSVMQDAEAQRYPERPVQIIVPFNPGGPTDSVTRILAERWTREFNSTVIVENRPGDSGIVGSLWARSQRPDGYALLMGSSTTHAPSSTARRYPYDPLRDFAPVVLAVWMPYVLVVPESSPARSVSTLISLARSRPDRLTYGSTGEASFSNRAAALFAATADLRITQVPLRGDMDVLTSVVGGQIDMAFLPISTIQREVRSGRLRVLAVTGNGRIPRFADVPTMEESGVRGYEVCDWMGLFAPRETPRDLIASINMQLVRILGNADVKARLFELGVEAGGGTPEQFAEFLRNEIGRGDRPTSMRVSSPTMRCGQPRNSALPSYGGGYSGGGAGSVSPSPRPPVSLPVVIDVPALPSISGKIVTQQTIEGGNAGTTIANATHANQQAGKKNADEAARTVKGLTQDEGGADGQRQRTCDAALINARTSLETWTSTVRTGIVPSDIEDFPAWYRKLPPERQNEAAVKEVNEKVSTVFATCFDSNEPPSFPAKLRDAIAVLSDPDNHRICTLMRVGDDRFVSARHCAERPETINSPNPIRVADDVLARYSIEMPAQPGKHFLVSGVVDATPSLNSRLLASDWVVFVGKNVPPGAEAPPVASTDEMLIGKGLLVAGLLIGVDDAGQNSRISYSGGLSCALVSVNDKCLMHTCNAFPGMSGAPIFLATAGEWKFAGIHSRAAATADIESKECESAVTGAIKSSRLNGGIYAGAIVKN